MVILLDNGYMGEIRAEFAQVNDICIGIWGLDAINNAFALETC